MLLDRASPMPTLSFFAFLPVEPLENMLEIILIESASVIFDRYFSVNDGLTCRDPQSSSVVKMLDTVFDYVLEGFDRPVFIAFE